MFIRKAKQRQDRNIVHNTDMGAGTSDNRYSEGLTSRVFTVKK
jgi:hypothetical protein